MIQLNYNVDEVAWKKNFPLFKKYIFKTVNETLRAVKISTPHNLNVSFFLTSNEKMKELNFKYRNKNKSTNVLSFPMKSNYEQNYYLGDIVLANQTLLEEANEIKMTKYDYLCKMTIHGMLHLLGFDHKTEKQHKIMTKFENLIFANIKCKS